MTRARESLERTTRATAAAELALILPIVMLLVAGVVEFGRIYEAYSATNRLAAQYALAWAGCKESPTGDNSFCQTEAALYTNASAISNIAPQLTIANLKLTMVEFTIASGGTPQVFHSSGYPSVDSGQLATATTVAAATFKATQTTADSQYIVVVVAAYAHQLIFFPGLMAPILGNSLNASYAVAQLK